MKFFDKGKSISTEYCEFCGKEIKPGEKMIVSTINPAHERQSFNRFNDAGFYSHMDNVPKYHENCFLDYCKKEKGKK